MVILKITSYYPLYLEQFYKGNNYLINATYSQQLLALNKDAFGWADFWSNALQDTDIHVIELTANNAYLQKAWAKEHNSTYKEDQWYEHILRAQVTYYKPDILFFEDRNINKELIRELKSLDNSLWATIAWCGTPFDDADEFSEYDAVFGCIPEVNNQLINLGIKAYQLDHAFDSRILNRLPKIVEKKYDLSFIGQIINHNGMHTNRFDYLNFLSKNTNIAIFSPQISANYDKKMKDFLHKHLWEFSEFIKINPTIKKVVEKSEYGRKLINLEQPLDEIPNTIRTKALPPVFGLKMFETIQQSKICFNIHIEASNQSASNMRLFESTGVGSCLLTDNKNNLSDFFKDGIEIMTYTTQEECLEKIHWLLKHPDKREIIAKKGQERTLNNHTFQNRAKDLQQILKKVIE